MSATKPENEVYNKKYYNMNEITPEELVEDYFASEEEAERQKLLDEGFVEVGTYRPGTPEEAEVDAKMEEFLDRME